MGRVGPNLTEEYAWPGPVRLLWAATAGGDVTALAGRFRIAINFPDRSMIGSHGYTSTMCAPKSILRALEEAAGGAPDS